MNLTQARYLYLVRHAKADEAVAPMMDFDRRLHTHGVLEATQLAKRLEARGLHVDCILSSAAPRALQTAIILAGYLGYAESRIKSEEDLYNTSTERLLRQLCAVSDEHQHVLLVNHNPSISDLVGHLSHHTVRMPTAGLVCLRYEGARWAELSRNTCQFEWHDFPQPA